MKRKQSIKITPEEVPLLSKYILSISGIALDKSKAYLIENRLGSLLLELRLSSYYELYNKAKKDNTKKIEQKIIDAISTNETLFFRDKNPFNLLKNKILPDLIDRKTDNKKDTLPVNIKIWSAACSTGQEVYSIAIILKEMSLNSKDFKIQLLGTDISDMAVARASYGKYNKFEIERGLSDNQLQKYFIPNGNSWKIKDEVRAMVNFKKFNLMMPLNGIGTFDIVLCRNVAIYFNVEDRKKLFFNISRILDKEGYLLIGSTESLLGICTLFKPQRHLNSVFYQLM